MSNKRIVLSKVKQHPNYWTCSKCRAIHRDKFKQCRKCKGKLVPPVNIPYAVNVQNNPSIARLLAFAAVVHTMRQTPSVPTRKSLLKRAIKEHPHIEFLFRITYDPNCRFGFKSKDVKRKVPGAGAVYCTVKEIFQDRIRNRGGKELALARWQTMVRHIEPEFQGTINQILDKNLRCGLNVKGVNQVFTRLGLPKINTKISTEGTSKWAVASV